MPAVQTLGDVIYPNTTQRVVPEKEWTALLRAIGAGDAAALDALFDRTHTIVFTLVLRITSSREAADDLTVEVYSDIWRRAAAYEDQGSVLAWVMNLARARAMAWLREQHAGRHSAKDGLLDIVAPDYKDLMRLREQSRALWHGLAGVGRDEREAVEATFFRGRTYVEAAERLGQPAAELRSRIRSALWKLGEYLAPGVPLDMSTCGEGELSSLLALRSLPPAEAAAHERHVEACWRCRRELEGLRPVLDALVVWPTDILRSPTPLRASLAQRMAEQGSPMPAEPAPRWSDPDWEEVAPGIFCRLMATDPARRRVSMLVRLAPNVHYPPHTHAGDEELHLLNGELWIDDRKLHPGDYNYAPPGTGDRRVWSATGCSCVLVTSTEDVLT